VLDCDLFSGDKVRPLFERSLCCYLLANELSVVCCYAQLRVWPSKSTEEQQMLVNNEEAIVYSQAIHYANRMVYLRVPLDATKKIRESATGMEGESLSSMVTNRY